MLWPKFGEDVGLLSTLHVLDFIYIYIFIYIYFVFFLFEITALQMRPSFALLTTCKIRA